MRLIMARRGRPKGSKNKPKTTIKKQPSAVAKKRGRPRKENNDLSTSTMDTAEINKTKLANGHIIDDKEEKDFVIKPIQKKDHNVSTSIYKSYIVNPDQYNLHSLYNSYKKSKDADKITGYHAGSVIYRALAEFETRCNFYINTTRYNTKKEIKQSIIKDLEILKNNIEKM